MVSPQNDSISLTIWVSLISSTNRLSFRPNMASGGTCRSALSSHSVRTLCFPGYIGYMQRYQDLQGCQPCCLSKMTPQPCWLSHMMILEQASLVTWSLAWMAGFGRLAEMSDCDASFGHVCSVRSLSLLTRRICPALAAGCTNRITTWEPEAVRVTWVFVAKSIDVGKPGVFNLSLALDPTSLVLTQRPLWGSVWY